jgi:cholest-4-en-3-one 26-monooxygenase
LHTPNPLPGFDFTDPDVYVERLPVEEFAEVRKAARICWIQRRPGKGGGFNDGGYWAITKHTGFKEVSLRSDVFSRCANCVITREAAA